MEFTINFNNGIRHQEECESIENAMKIADERAAYTQESITIENEFGDILARRPWYGCSSGIEETTNPIKFGDFGFYGDWIEF